MVNQNRKRTGENEKSQGPGPGCSEYRGILKNRQY